MTDRDIMQQALEALESDPATHAGLISRKQAITTLRQALVDADDTSQDHVDETAKQEHEPVAEIQAEDMGKPFNAIRVTVHFYAEVPAVGTKLYTAPPKQWVGLTDEEIDSIDVVQMKYIGSGEYVIEGEYEFARAIEAKLKEKNT